jgi:threonine dehydrogenase-like Zn-dependent dehydrogenase
VGGLLLQPDDRKYASGWGGFCEYTLVGDHDAMVADGVADAAHGWLEVYEIQRPVAADVPVAAAVLLCTWREVYGGFGDFNLQPHEHVLVFGAGPVGLSFVKFGRLWGLDYIAVADAVFAPDSPELATEITQTRRSPLDAVIDAVGNPAIANMALPWIKLGGTIGIYGVIADETVTIQKGRGPYNFNLYMHQWPTRCRERAAQELLCQWIRQGKLRAEDFITHEFPVEQVHEALEQVKAGRVIKALLRY